MRTLQILPSLEVGGVERGVIDLVRAMQKRGHSCVVISSGGELVGELNKIGVPHYTLPVHSKSLFSLSLVPKIAEIIQRERIDIVHARSRVPGWLGWLAARKTGKPFVTTCHGYYSNHFLSRVMGWGKRVIVISRVIGRHMIDDFGVSPDRIRLIHRGIDFSHFPLQAPQENSSRKTFRMIQVGRFSPIKGQLEFLRAVHLLRHRFPNVEAWLVGSEGNGKTKYTKKIQETIHQLGLQSSVKLLGTRRDVAELIRQCDLLVLPTLVPEAFGRVIIEAGALGVPVVATRVGGVLDIVEHGKEGLLVPPGDVEAMSQAIFEVLTDRERSRKMALALQEKVKTQFTIDLMTNQTLEVYQEAAKEKKILIIKLGAMGDVILATPSFRMIRERFPEAEISVLVDKKLAPLISSSPYLTQVIPVNRKKLQYLPYLLKVAKRLRKEGFDFSVDIQNTKWTHLLTWLSGIPERFGYSRGPFGFLVNRPDRNFSLADSPVKHQFRILSKLGVKELDEQLELWPDPCADERVENFLPEKKLDSSVKRVGLVMGSSPQWPTKRWPLSHFEELAKKLIQQNNCQIVLIGSPEDREYAQGIQLNGLSNQVLDLIGKTSMEELVSVIKRLDVIVTGDTAPLHVAAAVKTKIVSLFGPTDPRRHMPPAPGSIMLMRHLACQPCYKGECFQEDKLACLKRITVEEVMQAVVKQLSGIEKKEMEKQEVKK